MAAIAVPRLSGFTETANDRALEANIRTIEGAAAMYHAEYGSFPSDVAILVSDGYIDENPFSSTPGFDSDGSITGSDSLTLK